MVTEASYILLDAEIDGATLTTAIIRHNRKCTMPYKCTLLGRWPIAPVRVKQERVCRA